MDKIFIRIFLLLFIISTVAGLYSCKKQHRNEFVIHATIDSLPVSTIYLESIGIDVITLVDSTQSNKQGYFSLNGILIEPSIYRIRLGDEQYLYLYVDNDEIEIKANYSQPFNYAVAGSQGSLQLSNFLKQYYILNKEVIPLQLIYDSLYYAPNTDSLKTIVFNSLETKKSSLYQFIKNSADTSSYFQLATFYANFLNVQTEQQYLKTFNANLKNRFPNEKNLTQYISAINGIIQNDTVQNTTSKLNQLAPNFEIVDNNGQLIHLQKIKNKIVLLYFWAPWNQKSISELGHINVINDTNIVTIGVSIDDDKINWASIMESNNIKGIQVSTHQGWNCTIAKKYNVVNVPHYFTINEKGAIIYDGSSSEIARKLAMAAIAGIPKPQIVDSTILD